MSFRENILSIVVFLPLVGILAGAFIGKERRSVIKWLTLTVAVLEFIVSLFLVVWFDPSSTAMQFVERYTWIPAYNIDYHLGVDGLSLLLILLTTFLTPLVLLGSWTYIKKQEKDYYLWFLALETGMVGVFASLDLVLFYVFWEAMLVPMYIIIGVWGGPRRIYAAVKFFIYTMFGSLLMLIAILYLYFAHGSQTGAYTFDLLKLYGTYLPAGVQAWLFAAFALSFAIKVPLFPFHTWLPDAHVEAPTGGSVILAGVLLKMGTYGYMRFAMPLFPHAANAFLPYIAVLAIIGIIYGALVAMMQPDIKKLVAYSSVSHLGFVILGLMTLNMEGVDGSVLQMINHGLSTGALFMLVGMLYERRHTRELSEFGGIAKTMPVFATIFMIVTLSSIGLPGLNGFVGEFLILIGAFFARPVYAVFAGTGVILGAVYMLRTYQKVFWGRITNKANEDLKDLSPREIIVMVPVLIMIVWIGVYPKPFLSIMQNASRSYIQYVRRSSTGPGYQQGAATHPPERLK
ncbi:MAG: NADH-quinone oxidoreductase subunit M [Deltaproteobacteria bacterium]|nr:NADH-quinone oxidoreductase subunit M [Deltaproteobacteria bacterium]